MNLIIQDLRIQVSENQIVLYTVIQRIRVSENQIVLNILRSTLKIQNYVGGRTHRLETAKLRITDECLDVDMR